MAPVNTITGNNLDDKHLVQKVLDGDTAAFGVIIRKTERLVSQIIFKMIAGEEDRKDLAQDIYMKVYRKLPGFRFESKLSTWIAQISYHTCYDFLEKKRLVLLPDQNGEAPETQEETFDRLHAQQNRVSLQPDAVRQNLSGILQSEIEKLPPVFKTIITLYHNEELSYEEIGRIMFMPEGTIKSYLFRARRMLRNNLLLSYQKEDL